MSPNKVLLVHVNLRENLFYALFISVKVKVEDKVDDVTSLFGLLRGLEELIGPITS